MGKSKGEPDRLIGAFEKAVAHGFGLRDRVLEAWRDPFEYGPLLDKALAPYHSVLADFFVADTDKWDEQDRDNLLAAQALAEHQLEDLLKLDEEAPDILADQTIMIENDGTIIRKEEPDGKDGGRVKAPAHCCFTRLRLKNIHNRKIKVTARHESGAAISTEIGRGKKRPLHWTDGRGNSIPGAIGRCVDLEVQEKVRGRLGPTFKLRLCCEHDAQGAVKPKVGDRLTLTGPAPPPPPGGGTAVRPPSIRALEIVEIKVADPCPQGQSGSAGTATAGTASSGITAIPGLDIGGGNTYYGAHTRMRFVPRAGGCQKFCFIQGKIRKVRLKLPRQRVFRDARQLSTGDKFVLDVEKNAKSPCYPHVSPLPGGGLEMRDYPGVRNPQGRVSTDGIKTGRLPDGTQMEIKWTFRTWVVCIVPQRTAILGYFDWTVELELTVRRRRGATTGRVIMTRPRWSNRKDAAGYRDMLPNTPRNRPFLPPP